MLNLLTNFPLVLWSFGPLVFWSFGPLYCKSSLSLRGQKDFASSDFDEDREVPLGAKASERSPP
jgi:hypothetical protein